MAIRVYAALLLYYFIPRACSLVHTYVSRHGSDWEKAEKQSSPPSLNLHTHVARHNSSLYGSDWEEAEKQSYPPSLNLCSESKLLPSVYILGMPKCATTSLATDLKAAGVIWLGDIKELPAWSQKAIKEASPVCSDTQRQVVLTANPNRIWMQEQPTVIASMYGHMVGRVTFIVMMREPLARMISKLLFNRQVVFDVAKTFKQGPGALFAESEISGVSPAMQQRLVRESLYGEYLRIWREHFAANQFYMIPFKAYLENSQQICGDLVPRLGFDMRNPLGSPASTNEKHTSPEDSLSTESLENIRRKSQAYFANDTDVLMDQLTEGHRDGMGLAAYQGRRGSRDDIDGWLHAYW